MYRNSEMTPRSIFIVISVGCCILFFYSFHQRSYSCIFGPCGNDLMVDIRKHHLIPPPVKPKAKIVDADPSRGQRKIVSRILKDKKNGYFIECGANDGIFFSNTLWLEQEYGWTGLLIEADSESYAKLAASGRNAWKSNLCLSTKPYPQTLKFYRNVDNTGLNGLTRRDQAGVSLMTEVECVPFWDILQAINVTEVDYFSLDVEGHELEVLRTIPFDRLLIKVISIEYWTVPEGFDGVQQFMSSVGYHFVEDLPEDRDAVFAHPSVMS